jgi:hypothetical protein
MPLHLGPRVAPFGTVFSLVFMTLDTQTPLARPLYRCHKQVWALKIKAVLNRNEALPEDDGERVMTFSDPGYEACALVVNAAYMTKHQPEAGGYYVVYGDGYKSFSPATAFEEGYNFAVDNRVIGKGGKRRCNGGIARSKVFVVARAKADPAAGLERDGAIARQA